MHSRFRLLVLTLSLLTGAATAHAGLIGSTVTVGAYYPDTTSVYSNGGQTTISGAVEYPAGTFSAYNATWQVDITDTQFILTKTTAAGFPFITADFNGFILTVVSGPALTSAVIDPLSDFSPIGVSIVGNQLLLNFSGVNADNSGFPVSSIININASSTVPEPATWATVLLSGLGMAAFGRRGRAFFSRQGENIRD